MPRLEPLLTHPLGVAFLIVSFIIMAKIFRGVLGGIIGSISSLTGFHRLGKDVLTKRNNAARLTVSNSQSIIRANFKSVTSFAVTFYHIFLKKSIFSPNKYLSSWNWFIKENYPNFDENGISVPDQLKLSFGLIASSRIRNVSYSLALHRITISYARTGTGGESQPFDSNNVFIFNQTLNESLVRSPQGIRLNGVVTIQYPETWQVDDVLHIYLWYLKYPDWDQASVTAYRQSIIGV